MMPMPEPLSGLLPAARRQMRRMWAVAGSVSVRTKILGIVLGLVLLLGVAVIIQIRSTLRSVLSHHLENQGISTARDVAARVVDLLLVHDLFRVHQLLQDTLNNNREVRYVFIVGPDGEILAHTFGERFPSVLLTINTVLPEERYRLRKVASNEGIIYDFAVPVFDGRTGTVRLGLSEQALLATLSRVTRQLLLTTIVVSLAGVVAAIFLTWLITRPVLDLVKVTRAVAQGDLSRQAPHWADDEIGRLSDSFNAMIFDLSEAQAESEAYNTTLVRRNRELAALNQVVQVVSRQQDLQGMLDTALRRVLDLMRREAGWITLQNAEGLEPQLVCAVGLPRSLVWTDVKTGMAACPCNRVMEEKIPLIVQPLPKDCPMYGLRLGTRETVCGHVAVPLISKSQVLGTLNFPCNPDDSCSDEDMQLLAAIGRQLGVAVENALLLQEVRQKKVARGQLLEKIITAQEEERKRIARELHDGTSQSLTSLMVGLKVIQGIDSPVEIRRHLASLRDIAAETLETVHDLALELRPSVLDDMGLVAALERYVTEYRVRFNIHVDCQVVWFDARRLPPVIETALYRIVQEALTNVARHSGADRVGVVLERNSQLVRIVVEDNGSGFDVAGAREERKLGLYGMEERAVLIGGELRIESQPGMGTMIVVNVPVTEAVTTTGGS